MSVSENDIRAVKSSIQAGDIQTAIKLCQELLLKHPDDRNLLTISARLYIQTGQHDAAANAYQRFLTKPALAADDMFNIGFELKRLEFYELSLSAYQRALDSHISRPEEVHLNMGVIYADHVFDEQKAIASLQQAISLNPEFEEAYNNLGNLYEESGDFDAAARNYRKALEHIPRAYEALAKLANSQNISDANHPLLGQIHDAVKSPGIDPFSLECLYFALGQAYDNIGDYKTAFDCLKKANQQGQSMSPPYDRRKTEGFFNDITSAFPESRFTEKPYADPQHMQPVFICGMFRSGSTLIEQVLAAHPDITPLGELAFFDRYCQRYPGFFPHAASRLDENAISQLRQTYLASPPVQTVNTSHFTDKRPDNFLYLGLIKRIFPEAKIIHTTRQTDDNALSIYFTQFGDGQAYARDLDDIAHYRQQHDKLMHHWTQCFGDDILNIVYDDFIMDSERISKDLIVFCGLDWTPDCLNFHKLRNRVKTASYKQVRRPLYTSSSGRAANYQGLI